MIAASICFNGVMEAQSGVLIMFRLRMMKLIPKLSYRNHWRTTRILYKQSPRQTWFVRE